MNSQRVCEFMSRDVCEQKITNPFYASIAVYPQNNVRDLAKIMKDIRIDYLPVFFSPWNKRQIGFIEFNKIRIFLND
jgi:hypothetical protein